MGPDGSGFGGSGFGGLGSRGGGGWGGFGRFGPSQWRKILQVTSMSLIVSVTITRYTAVHRLN